MDSKTFESIVNIINKIALKHKIFSEQYYQDNPSFNLKTLTINKIVDETSYDNHFFDVVTDTPTVETVGFLGTEKFLLRL